MNKRIDFKKRGFGENMMTDTSSGPTSNFPAYTDKENGRQILLDVFTYVSDLL